MNRSTQYLQGISSGEDIAVGQLVDHIIHDAVTAQASDIHLEPWESSLAVRLRIHGVLEELIHLPLDLMEKISSRLKVMAELVNYEFDRPQEGHVKVPVGAKNVELRVSFFPVVFGSADTGASKGEKIVVRIFDTTRQNFELEELGFDSGILKALRRLLSKPSGMILLTGPTGSGKTTAIYAALNHLVNLHGPSISISTVEDPVEFNLPMVSQSQINPARDFTYPIALRSLMRQDPQVIMVGEIRDPETASIAVQAGLTGHLVITTIHADSTTGVFARLINMDIEPFLLASSVVGVLGLRLIRKNCAHCSELGQPSQRLLGMIPPDIAAQATWKEGRGCDACHHTGFSGQTSVPEMLVVDEVLRDAILEKLPTNRLQAVAIRQGMRTHWQTAIQRTLKGETTLAEVVRVISLE